MVLVYNYLLLYLLGFCSIDVCQTVFNMKALLIMYPALLSFYLLSEICFPSWEKLVTSARLMKCLDVLLYWIHFQMVNKGSNLELKSYENYPCFPSQESTEDECFLMQDRKDFLLME